MVRLFLLMTPYFYTSKLLLHKCRVSSKVQLISYVRVGFYLKHGTNLILTLFENYTISRISHRGCSAKNGVLRNFAKFTGKHQCQLKKRPWHWCFPVNSAKFLRTSFLQNISRRNQIHSNDDIF